MQEFLNEAKSILNNGEIVNTIILGENEMGESAQIGTAEVSTMKKAEELYAYHKENVIIIK